MNKVTQGQESCCYFSMGCMATGGAVIVAGITAIFLSQMKPMTLPRVLQKPWLGISLCIGGSGLVILGIFPLLKERFVAPAGPSVRISPEEEKAELIQKLKSMVDWVKQLDQDFANKLNNLSADTSLSEIRQMIDEGLRSDNTRTHSVAESCFRISYDYLWKEVREIPCERDGNCFYHAVAALTDRNYIELREQQADYFRKEDNKKLKQSDIVYIFYDSLLKFSQGEKVGKVDRDTVQFIWSSVHSSIGTLPPDPDDLTEDQSDKIYEAFVRHHQQEGTWARSDISGFVMAELTGRPVVVRGIIRGQEFFQCSFPRKLIRLDPIVIKHNMNHNTAIVVNHKT